MYDLDSTRELEEYLSLEESEADKLVTKAIVLGDFESAISFCLSSRRLRTQKAYFDPYKSNETLYQVSKVTSTVYGILIQSDFTQDLD